jgi:hypothetical protein
LLVPADRTPRSIHAADKALEVVGLGQGEDDGMVRSCGAGFEQGDAAAGVGSGIGDDSGEGLEGDVVGAGAGEEDSAGDKHLEGAEVELLVAAESGVGGAF